MGVGTIGGTDFTLGSSGGSANTPVISHTHPITNQSVAISDPGHFHVADGTNGSFNFPARLGIDGTFDAESIYARADDAAYQAGSRVGTARTGITASVNIGIGAPSESVVGTLTNLPPYQVFYYIIRMSDEGTGGGTIQAGIAIDIARNGGFSVINNTGVTRLIAGTGVTLSSETGNITINSSGGGGTADIAGSIKLWGGSTEPTDWMFCDGRALSRDAYPSLFAKIGTTYGAGDGTTTFNLPNITNRFAVGAGGLYPNGATGGSADAVVVSHTHTLTDPGHRHSQYAEFFNISSVASGALLDRGTAGVGGNTSIATTGITINSAGQSGTNANLPPYLGLRYIIKINDNGTQRSGAGGGDTSRAGDIKWVAYAQANFPPGWQLCDGTALVRASYPALFSRIGTTYGAGNGTTTFNVPDLRGRFVVSEISGATGASRASVNRGNVGGDANAVVVSHTHTASSSPHQHSSIGYNGAGLIPYGTLAGQPRMGMWSPQDNNSTHVLTSPATVSVTVDSAGSSGTNANMPPYVTMVAIIKLDDDSVNTGGILQAGPGISLTTSGAYTTITNTAQGGLAPIAGRGITTTATAAGTIINASVAGIVAGNNITVSVNNEGIVTINSTASGGGSGGGFGYGTWVNVRTQRALNTTYTNTTGAPIQVFVCLNTDAPYTQFACRINGSTNITFGRNAFTDGTNGYASNYLVIPPDNTYAFVCLTSGGVVTSGTIHAWWELQGAPGGGSGGVASITAQAPLNASTSSGAVTLSLSGSVITTGNQTFNGEKTFVNPIRGAGGIICNSYNFSDTSSSMFWTGSEINLNVAGLMRFYVRSDKAGFSYSTVEKVGGGSFASYSDQRYKQDIVVYDKGLNEIKTLVPQKFRYTREFMRAKKPSKEFVGLIAQMVETGPFASCVSTDENGYKTVDVSELTFALINAVKELSDRLEKLESK
jgi:microcystin-dependent protein